MVLASHLFAQLARLRLIQRWPLMYSVQSENVAEHSLQVAMVAHGLAVIRNSYFAGQVNVDRVTTLALFHDASEVLTGDLPTPVKYHNPALAQEYKKIEAAAEQRLLSMVPPPMRDSYQGLFVHDDNDDLLQTIVKDADTLCAYLKCIQELHMGNHEFRQAKRRLEAMLDMRMNDSIRFFLEHFLPSFTLPLDDIADDPEHPLVQPQK